MAGDSGSPSLLWVCFRFRCFLGIDFGHSIVTLEQYITKKHKSLQSQTNKDLGRSFFKEDTSYCHIGILDWEFVPPQFPFHMEGCMCICTSLKQNYIYNMAMSGLGMANLDEHTSKQDFNNQVGRRMQYTYFMQYTSVHKPRKTKKNIWNNLETFTFENVLKAKVWTLFATLERPSLSTKKCQINFKSL